MFASIFILILFLPAACLPLAFDIFFSSSELDEMGICLETPDESFPTQGDELVGFHPTANHCKNADGCVWEIRKELQTCL